MKTRDCTECGHETATEGNCGHCGAPRLRASAFTAMLERPALLRYGGAMLLLAFCCAAAFG